MQTEHVKAAVTAAWVLVIGAVGYISGATSFAAWAGLVVLSVVAPVIMMRFWSTPTPSMSDTIRDVLR